MSDFYILKGKEPIRVDDVLEWARWYETVDRKVAHTMVGGASISTVFLGLDHNFGYDLNAPPILFETMVFRDGKGGEMDRYSTWEEAEAGHEMMVRTEKLRQQAGIGANA